LYITVVVNELEFVSIVAACYPPTLLGNRFALIHAETNELFDSGLSDDSWHIPKMSVEMII